MITTHLAKRMLEAIGEVYVSLHSAAPGELGEVELTGRNYQRRSTTLEHQIGWVVANGRGLDFEGLPTATVTHIGLWDLPRQGRFFGAVPLTESVDVAAGGTLRFDPGDLQIRLTGEG